MLNMMVKPTKRNKKRANSIGQRPSSAIGHLNEPMQVEGQKLTRAESAKALKRRRPKSDVETIIKN